MAQSGHHETLLALMTSVTAAEQEHLPPDQGVPRSSQAGEDTFFVQQLGRECAGVSTTIPESAVQLGVLLAM